ncbi:ANM_collapsed_G0053420.mRNA.1.CDS.1 [Saccharomyces cerevisiae]|nr:ANM_collapsed_G0053420.mRNA.1.CDS.1 [Saccharomyces cerevisiae]
MVNILPFHKNNRHSAGVVTCADDVSGDGSGGDTKKEENVVQVTESPSSGSRNNHRSDNEKDDAIRMEKISKNQSASSNGTIREDLIMDVDLEKSPSVDGDSEPHKLKQGLQSRHVQLIALGGAIGTGLLVGDFIHASYVRSRGAVHIVHYYFRGDLPDHVRAGRNGVLFAR